MSAPFAVDQDSYRWRNDDGTEVTATYNKIVNTLIVVGDEGGTDFAFGVPIRLRGLLQETGGDMGVNNVIVQLQVQLNSDGFNNVTASSAVARAIASQLVDTSDTTSGSHDLGSGSFVTPNALQEEGDGASGGGNLDIAAGFEWEPENSIEIIGADVGDGDTVTFLWLTAGVAPDTTSATPTITIDKAPPPPFPEELLQKSRQNTLLRM